jgi:hypothetical protein
VGPTVTGAANARPTPDDTIDFEDLMVFAINYGGTYQALQYAAAPLAVVAGTDELWLESPTKVAAGETFAVTLRVRCAGDLQGVSTQLGWDRTVAEPIGVDAGGLITARNGVVFSAQPGNVDCAVLGAGRGIAGEGALATLTFRALANGDPKVGLAKAEARNASNQPVALGTVGRPEQTRAVTQLMPAMPNPFNRSAVLSFSLAIAGPAELSVYSVDGRRVRVLASGTLNAGVYRLTWDGTDERGVGVKVGMYYARLSTAEGRFTRTVVLVK